MRAFFDKPIHLTVTLIVLTLGGLSADLFLFHRDESDTGSLLVVVPVFVLIAVIAIAVLRGAEREDAASRALQDSEAKFRDLVETSSDWYWEMDADLRFTGFSGRMEEIIGIDPRGLIGKTRAELTGAVAETPEWAEHLRALAAREPFRDFVYPISGQGAETVWIRVSGRPVFDEAGAFSGYRGTASNVTVAKMLEQQGERARKRMEGVLRATPDAYLVFSAVRDRDGAVADFRLDLLNRAAEELTGADRNACIGKLLVRQMADTFDPALFALCRDVWSGGARVEEERRLSVAGTERWFRVVVAAVSDGAAVSLADISDRKAQEAAIAGLLDKVRDSNAELQSFSYAVSHDLQEPLRMVSSYLKLLERRYGGELSAEAMEFIHYAVDGAARMHHLIQDLLAYSRVTTRGKEAAPVDMNAVMGHVLANLSLAAQDAGAIVRVDDGLPTVLADETQMVSLLQNLLGNAIKYRAEGRTPDIHVGVRRDGGETVFFVADNGIGINPKFFDRIFQVFQRLHTSDEYEGTGVGLSIAKRIVERHGGRIWVESTPGVGSTFLFTLGAGPSSSSALA